MLSAEEWLRGHSLEADSSTSKNIKVRDANGAFSMREFVNELGHLRCWHGHHDVLTTFANTVVLAVRHTSHEAATYFAGTALVFSAHSW